MKCREGHVVIFFWYPIKIAGEVLHFIDTTAGIKSTHPSWDPYRMWSGAYSELHILRV